MHLLYSPNYREKCPLKEIAILVFLKKLPDSFGKQKKLKKKKFGLLQSVNNDKTRKMKVNDHHDEYFVFTWHHQPW